MERKFSQKQAMPVAPGHDGWVIGDETVIAYEIVGAVKILARGRLQINQLRRKICLRIPAELLDLPLYLFQCSWAFTMAFGTFQTDAAIAQWGIGAGSAWMVRGCWRQYWYAKHRLCGFINHIACWSMGFVCLWYITIGRYACDELPYS